MLTTMQLEGGGRVKPWRKVQRFNKRMYQLGKMRKYIYITNRIANMIYKQAIVLLIDYLDFLIDSGPKCIIERLVHLDLIIDCNGHKHVNVDDL